MGALTLVIGNKNYSSWSLRPWMYMTQSGIAFSEKRIPLSTEQWRREIGALSPSLKVPALHDDDLVVWESLAICEYLAEQFPRTQGWPVETAARAVARAVSAEMHAGFADLRECMPMNCRLRCEDYSPPERARADIARIRDIWGECRRRYGADGPWLFGRFCIADAMYAPVALRFASYCVVPDEICQEYVNTLLAAPAVQAWVAEAKRETEVLADHDAIAGP